MGVLVKAIAAPFKLYHSVADEIAKERRLALTNGTAWSMLFGRTGAAGKNVTIDTALQLSTVWACIRLTAQAMGSLPVGLFEKTADDGRNAITDHALADVLSISPNADQTAIEFWETVVAWMLASGNSYSEIAANRFSVSALNPIPSTHCLPDRDRATGDLVYRVSDRGKTETLPAEKVFHLKWFDIGCDLGLSPIRYGVQTFSSALAADETAGKLFSNGMQPSGILQSDQTLTADQRTQLQTIMEKFAGSTNAGKLMILEAGLKFQALALNPEDGQLLDTRRFNVEEMCRWFGVPPIIVGHAGQGQTMWGSGVEQILLAWLALGINPLARKIEARIRKQLIRPAERQRLYAEFNREGMLQMDSAAKAQFLSTVVQNGLMDRNEGRKKLNLSARGGADVLTAQTNLAPLDRLGQTGGSADQQARNAFLTWLGIGQKEAA